MSVAIRLMRFGKKGAPTYRVVAVHKRSKAVGAYLENLGHYNPMVEPPTIVIKHDRVDHWISRGAQLSEGCEKLMKHEKSLAKKKAVKPTKKVDSKSAKSTKPTTKETKPPKESAPKEEKDKEVKVVEAKKAEKEEPKTEEKKSE